MLTAPHPLFEITIRQTVPCEFDRGPIRELPHALFKPLRDRLFDLVPEKLDEGFGPMETFRPNIGSSDRPGIAAGC